MNDHRTLKPESEALAERLRILKQTLPECFSEGRLDPDKLRETLGEENLDEGPKRYGLNWPGKREASARAFKPSNMALHFAPKQGMNEKDTKNLIIEGENLEVLRLLQKAYRGRVKMIYIDPPYNTGNDFVYDDKFAESPLEYEKRTGQRAEDGTALQSNRKSSGRFHSNWLSMMYPRLVLARELLAADGILYCSVDDNEVQNLKIILEEIWGAECFVEDIFWKNKYGSGALTKVFANVHKYVLCFSKRILENISAPLNEEQIKSYSLRDSKHEVRKLNEQGEDEFLGYVVRAGGIALYHSGDCVLHEGLVERLTGSGIDLALLPINGRNEHRRSNGVPGNFTFEEAVRLCEAAGIPSLLCHHYGMFDFNTADLGQARALLKRLHTPVQVLFAGIGVCQRVNATG